VEVFFAFAMLFIFLYFLSVFIRKSAGFSASFGIAQAQPRRTAPFIRPCSHKTCTLRGDIFHFLAACFAVK
jgi:hypothetical protein